MLWDWDSLAHACKLLQWWEPSLLLPIEIGGSETSLSVETSFYTVLHSKRVNFFVTLSVDSFWPITNKKHADGQFLFEWKLKLHANPCDDAQLWRTISHALYVYCGPTYTTKKERCCETRDTKSNKFDAIRKLLDDLFQRPLQHWYGCCYKLHAETTSKESTAHNLSFR